MFCVPRDLSAPLNACKSIVRTERSAGLFQAILRRHRTVHRAGIVLERR